MDKDLFSLRSSKNDRHDWGKTPFEYGKNGLYLPQHKVYSIHSGWSDIHFHIFDRAKYTLFGNVYDIKDSRKAKAESDASSLEFTMMMNSQIINKLGAYKPDLICPGDFNISYYPEVDSTTEFHKGQFYFSLDIHLKESMINDLYMEFPQQVVPFLDAMSNKAYIRLSGHYLPATQFMKALANSILTSLKKGPAYLPMIDKDVEALIRHALNYSTTIQVTTLDKRRVELMGIIYDKILTNLSKYPGTKELSQLINSNPTTLNQVFKNTFETTIKQCWLKYRLDEALHMVAYQREKHISDIAEELGYSCRENFTHAFKAIFNITPQSLRNQQNKNGFDPFSQINF